MTSAHFLDPEAGRCLSGIRNDRRTVQSLEAAASAGSLENRPADWRRSQQPIGGRAAADWVPLAVPMLPLPSPTM
jgi:hypothetical protein